MAGSWPSSAWPYPAWPTRSARAAARCLGIATGLSLAIGLEMLIYLALLGGGDGAAVGGRPRSAPAAGGLCRCAGGDDGFGFLIFASYANRQAVCDALSPVWLSDAAVGGAVMLGLSPC